MLGLPRVACHRGVDLGHLVQQRLVVRAVPGLVEVELVVERLLVEERQEGDPPAQERLAVLADRGGGEPAAIAGEVVHGQADEPGDSSCSAPGLAVVVVASARAVPEASRPRCRRPGCAAGPPFGREQADSRRDEPRRHHTRRDRRQSREDHGSDLSFYELGDRGRDHPGRHRLASREMHRGLDRGLGQPGGHGRGRGLRCESIAPAKAAGRTNPRRVRRARKQFPGPGQADAHRADRASQQPGGLGVGPALEVAEHQRGAVLLRQAVDLLVQRLELLPTDRVRARMSPSSPAPALRAAGDGPRRPWPAPRPAGPPRGATGRPRRDGGSNRPGAPGPGRSPGTRPPPRASRTGCRGRHPRPSGRGSPPGRRTPPRPPRPAGGGTAPVVGRPSSPPTVPTLNSVRTDRKHGTRATRPSSARPSR